MMSVASSGLNHLVERDILSLSSMMLAIIAYSYMPLKCENAKEYQDSKFTAFAKDNNNNNIDIIFVAPYSAQQNGKAKVFNRILYYSMILEPSCMIENCLSNQTKV
jgi:hypothetical protein